MTMGKLGKISSISTPTTEKNISKATIQVLQIYGVEWQSLGTSGEKDAEKQAKAR